MERDEDDLRALWARQPTKKEPIMSLEEVKKMDTKLSRRVRVRNATEYAAAALVVLAFARVALEAKGAPVVRAGCAMIIAGVIFVGYRIARHGAASAPPPDDAPASNVIAHHRASLAKQRDLLESAWRWYLGPLVPGVLVLLAGVAFDAPSPRPAPILMRLAIFGASTACVLATFVVIGWVNRRGARKLGEQMKALDACDDPPLP